MTSSTASIRATSSPVDPGAAASITVLADDLTGACDAAAALLGGWGSSRIWLNGNVLHETSEAVQAFHTDSRELTAELAAEAVARAAGACGAEARRFVFKKVDSAGRGAIAAELLALERVLQPRAVILAPAFPEARRTVRDGILRITDATGLEASVALEGLFPEEELWRIALVGSAAEMEAALKTGKSILICDAENDADLVAVVDATAKWTGCLYAGSAGLALALAGRFGASTPAQAHPRAERLLIFSGTVHPLTQLQISHLGSALDWVRVEQLQCMEEEQARICDAFHVFAPDALLLTGGETAQLVLRALGAESIVLGGECARGIPWGTVQGGLADGRVVITKSGGFGTATVLREIAERLKGE